MVDRTSNQRSHFSEISEVQSPLIWENETSDEHEPKSQIAGKKEKRLASRSVPSKVERWGTWGTR